ncbi:MAG: VRR-NUC domain-containing protein [Bacteroidaceae bacterium]
MRTIESQIQIACMKWFRYQYPKLSKLCFAVPNGGNRSIVTAKILKAEGVVAGVSDIILLCHNRFYNSLCIEMKQPKGKQSENQIAWQTEAENANNKYVVCHSVDEFIEVVETYLKDK